MSAFFLRFSEEIYRTQRLTEGWREGDARHACTHRWETNRAMQAGTDMTRLHENMSMREQEQQQQFLQSASRAADLTSLERVEHGCLPRGVQTHEKKLTLAPATHERGDCTHCAEEGRHQQKAAALRLDGWCSSEDLDCTLYTSLHPYFRWVLERKRSFLTSRMSCLRDSLGRSGMTGAGG